MTTGVSDLTLSGTLRDYINLAFPSENSGARFNGTVTSKVLDLNDMLVTQDKEETEEQEEVNLEELLKTLPVPPNLAIDTDIGLGRVRFGKLETESVRGSVTVSQGTMKLNDLDIRAYGGKLHGNAALNVTEEPSTYEGSFKLDRLEAGTFISSLSGIGENIFGGSLSSSLSFKGNGLDPDSMLKNLSALGSFSMNKGSITNWEFTRSLGRSLKFLDFDTLDFNRIVASFSVADERVFTDDLDAATDYGAFTIAGGTGFDKSIDYDIVFKLNKKARDLAQKNNLELISELLEDETGTPTLNIKAGGSLTAPTFTIDTSEAGKRAKDRLKNEAEKLLDKQSDELKKEGRKLLKKLFK
jgi:hypothetical protein